MNKNQLVLLIVIGAVLGGIGYSLRTKEQATWSQSAAKMGDKLFSDFKVNDVESVSIKSPASSVTLAKKSDVWGVAERSDYPANFGTLQDFLLKVMELKVGQPVKVSGGQLSRLELVSPDKGTNAGTAIDFKDKAGKTITSLMLGKKVTKDSPGASPFGGGSYPVGRYVMVGNDPKNVAVVSEAFASIEPKISDWLEKDFLKVEKLKAISITAAEATNSWKVTRETESGEWHLADAKGEEKLDTSKVSGFNYLLNSPSFQDVFPGDKKAEETGLDKPSLAKLETFDNFAYTVKIGKTDTEGRHYVQFVTTAELPKERAVGKDEKPEDKDKLDKEFKDKTQKMAEKLKKEQFHDKWIYLFDHYAMDNLLKKRVELMAEKKDETKKDDAPPKPPGIPGVGPLPNLDQ